MGFPAPAARGAGTASPATTGPLGGGLASDDGVPPVRRLVAAPPAAYIPVKTGSVAPGSGLNALAPRSPRDALPKQGCSGGAAPLRAHLVVSGCALRLPENRARTGSRPRPDTQTQCRRYGLESYQALAHPIHEAAF